MAMEEMSEEFCALLLAKLEEIGDTMNEIGRKLDDRNQMLDDTNQKLEEMNARLCSRAEPPASSSTPSTSSPPRGAAQVVSIATSELPPETPPRCSTTGPNQDARVPAPADSSSASPATSPTSSPPPGAATVIPMATLELPTATSARCSVLGLYQAAQVSVTATTTTAPPTASSTSTMPQNVFLTGKIVTIKHPFMAHSKCLMSVPSPAAHVVMSAATSSAPPTPSSTSAPPQGIILADPIAFTKHAAAAPTGCPMLGCCSVIVVPAPMVSSTAATALLHNIAGHHVSEFSTGMSIDASLPYHVVGICGSQMLFEVYLSECLELYPSRLPLMLAQLTSHNMMQLKIPWPPPKPPEIIVATAELRPTPWPSFKFSQQGMFVQFKIPWPPHVQIVVGKVVGLQPMLWPSLFSCLTRVQWRQEPLMLEFAVSEFSTWLRTNVTVLSLFVRPIFCTLWRKCLEETETQVQDQLMHLLLALVSSWMVWCSHLKVDGCSRKEAIDFFQPYVHVILLDNETCKWSLVWIAASVLPENPNAHAVYEIWYSGCVKFSWQLVLSFLPHTVDEVKRSKLWDPGDFLCKFETTAFASDAYYGQATILIRWYSDNGTWILHSCTVKRCLLQATQLVMLLTDSDYLSSWVLSRYQNIERETTCFLNDSKQQILKQEGEARVHMFEFGKYKYYLKLLDGSYRDGGLTFSIKPQVISTKFEQHLWNLHEQLTYEGRSWLIQLAYPELLAGSNTKQLKHVTATCLHSEFLNCKEAQLQLKAARLLKVSDQASVCKVILIQSETVSSQDFLSDLMDKSVALQASIELVFQIHDDMQWSACLQTTLNILQVPWDPGELERGVYVTATAWGQAVFQGGKNVRDLQKMLLTGTIPAPMCRRT